MKNNKLHYLAFTFFLLFTAYTQAQDNTVRIPLKTFGKPAGDLKGNAGDILSTAQIKEQFDSHIDLSTINPANNKFWQDTDLRSNTVSDPLLHQKMPSDKDVLIYNSFAGVVRQIGMYAIYVHGDKDPQKQIYRLKSGFQVHASLLKAALLRKIGIFQEAPKYMNSVRLKFSSLEELNGFILQAFCSDDPDQISAGCLPIDPQMNGYLSEKNEFDLTILVHGSYLEKLNPEVPNLFDGITPSTMDNVSLYAQSRAYRALIAPYLVADIGESINRFSTQAAAVRGGVAYLNYSFSSDFNNLTTVDDVKWILRKMAELTAQDWDDIITAAAYPQQLRELVKAKVLRRHKNMIETFFEAQESEELLGQNRIEIRKLKDINSGDGLVVKGKVMREKLAGYPQRFSHGDRKSPFESGDFLKLLNVKTQSVLVETALARLSDKLQKLNILSQDIKGIELGPNGVRPLVDANFLNFGVNASANRMVTTGTFYGSQAAVQLVDSLTMAASMGYFHVMDGLTGFDKIFGAGVSYIRNFTHVKPIAAMKDATKVKLKDLYIPSVLDKLASPLKDGKLTEFLTALKTGEVFTITDSIGGTAQFGINTTMASIAGLAAPFSLTGGLSVDGNMVVLRQIQFVRTDAGLQIYIRDQNSKAFGLEMNVNYFINLLKIRAETKRMDLHTRAYLLDYNADLMVKIENLEVIPDSELEKKIAKMKAYGNKAALALRALLMESNEDPLALNFAYQRFDIHHKLKTSDFSVKLLMLRDVQLNEEHLMTIKKPELPIIINGVEVKNQPIKIVTYKKGRLHGVDKLGFAAEIIDATLKKLLDKDAPVSVDQVSQNPSQTPFGKAQWTTVRADTELTQDRPGALPSVAIVEHVWSGWSLKKKALNEILDEVKEETKGVNFANYPLIPQDALIQVKEVDFYRITSHLSILPEGLTKIKDLLLSTNEPPGSLQKNKGISKFFQKLSETLGGKKAQAADKVLYNNLVKMLGNGDQVTGENKFMAECVAERQRVDNTQFPITSTWLKGTNYPCMISWMERLIVLSRKFPKDDLRQQNRWLAEVLYVIDEKIPLAAFLNYLGPDKFIFYIEVTGFRSGDEDGNDGNYISNVYGEPNRKLPYANGLLSVIADKSRINMTELDRTLGGFQ